MVDKQVVMVFTKYDKPYKKIHCVERGDVSALELVDGLTELDGSVDLSLKTITLKPVVIERGLEGVIFITYAPVKGADEICEV